MSKERITNIAFDLLKLGVSHAGVQELLVNYPYDLIERQISFMPHRKAKRPEAFIMEAVRRNYSPPKELFYAKNKDNPSATSNSMDKGAKRPFRQITPDSQGYGIAAAPDYDSSDLRLESREPIDIDDL